MVDDTPVPLLQVLDARATPEEIAALVAVLQAAAGAARATAAPAGPDRPRTAWSAPQRAVRRPLQHGPGGWRVSGLPS